LSKVIRLWAASMSRTTQGPPSPLFKQTWRFFPPGKS